jgi:pyruvate carboxylase subunit B
MTYTFKHNNELYKVILNEDKNQLIVEIDGTEYPVEYSMIDNNMYSIIIDGKSTTLAVLKKGKNIQVFHNGNLRELEYISEREILKGAAVSSGLEITSPMPSRVVKILKEEGDEVELDEGVIVVEAMKMESELKAPSSGKIKEIRVSEGDAVESGTILVVLSAE